MFIVLIIVGVLAVSFVVGWGVEVLWKRRRKIKERTKTILKWILGILLISS